MMKIWEKLEGKSSYHFPNSWWVRGRIVPNTCILKKLGRAHEDQMKPRTSELFDSKTLEHFNIQKCEFYCIQGSIIMSHSLTFSCQWLFEAHVRGGSHICLISWLEWHWKLLRMTGRLTRHRAHVTMLQVMSQSWASSVMFSMCVVDRLWWLHNFWCFDVSMDNMTAEHYCCLPTANLSVQAKSKQKV